MPIDPFVSTEPAVELDSETRRILKERVQPADQRKLVSASEAREHIKKWLSNSATTKTL